MRCSNQFKRELSNLRSTLHARFSTSNSKVTLICRSFWTTHVCCALRTRARRKRSAELVATLSHLTQRLPSSGQICAFMWGQIDQSSVAKSSMTTSTSCLSSSARRMTGQYTITLLKRCVTSKNKRAPKMLSGSAGTRVLI